MWKHSRRTALGLAACAVVSGCGGNSAPNGPVISPTRQVGNLAFSVEANKRVYQPGEAVNFTLRVTNTGAVPATLSGSTGEASALVVEVFRTAKNSQDIYSAAVGDITLQPGEARALPLIWNQRHPGARATEDITVPGGPYFVRARLTRSGEPTEPVALEVDAPCREDPVFVAPNQVILGVKEGQGTPAFFERIRNIGTVNRPSLSGTSYLIQLSNGVCIQAGIQRLQVQPEVRYAEPNGLATPGGGTGGGSL